MPRGKKKNKEVDLASFLWSAAGLVLVLIFLFSVSTSGKNQNIRMTIDYGNGIKRNFETTLKGDMSAWDMLQQANAAYEIPIEVEKNFIPKKIGEKSNGMDGKNWKFYLDGKMRQESPYEIKLSGGEQIIFKFE